MTPIQPPPLRTPSLRVLRVYGFDPSLDWQLETAFINQMTLKVPWEDVEPGPVGEYLEVVDVDPASGCCYAPVDLDHPYILAQDGLAPAEGEPQFHQQMVYAVAMTTIRNFERALGRRIFWSDNDDKRAWKDDDLRYVQRLRIYPHALREANAYYSPQKKALLFGYFPASTADPGRNLPGGTVFTCLSHDIVAHETTHALLDGLHRRLIEPVNGDTLALHEGFADIVALFQHFTFPEVLRDQIGRTRGDLAAQNLLGALAHQFGQAIGSYGALRDAIGTVDPVTKKWQAKEADPAELQRAVEPHARGAILVAAVFDAFLAIYKSRISDLVRLATGGTGILSPGDIHPDLVERMAREASASAAHVLNMCIRALDYCPPVDVNFGDYLRALVTADRDLVPNDDRHYRIAVIEAFRRRGIYPQEVRSLSIDSVCWGGPSPEDLPKFQELLPAVETLRQVSPEWSLPSDRKEAWKGSRASARAIHEWLEGPGMPLGGCLGLAIDPGLGPDQVPWSIPRRDGLPVFEVHSVRPARRATPDGDTVTDLVIEITQRRRAYLDPAVQAKVDGKEMKNPPKPDFWFRGGCTVIVDLEKREVRYSIGKSVTSASRLEAQRRYSTGASDGSLGATYFGDPRLRKEAEPFAFLHRAI
jgi:hypothetical protein